MPPVDGLSPLHPAASFDLAFDRPELLAILAWAITSSFGVVLFAFVIRAGTAPIGPAALAVLAGGAAPWPRWPTARRRPLPRG